MRFVSIGKPHVHHEGISIVGAFDPIRARLWFQSHRDKSHFPKLSGGEVRRLRAKQRNDHTLIVTTVACGYVGGLYGSLLGASTFTARGPKPMLFVRRSIAAFASSTAASGLGQAKPTLSVENITPSMTTGCLSARPNLECPTPLPSSNASISKS